MNQIDTETNEEQTLSKKERNEIRRVEQQRKREREIKIKKVKGWLPWIIFVGIIIGLVYWAVVVAQKAEQSRPGDEISIMSSEHISVGDPHEPYNSNPPTSGPHAGPLPWGFYEEEVADEDAIHNLEHGGIWISYKDLDQQSIDTLREIARENSFSVTVSPRDANDNKVAVASWGRLMKLETVDFDAIMEFIRKNKNKSPEPIAR